MHLFISLYMVYSSIIMRIIITLHFRRSRTASNFYFTVGRWEVGNHNMWLGSFWYVHTQVVVHCTLHIFLIHAKLHTHKSFPAVNSIAPFLFSEGACFQHIFTRPCEARKRSIKTYLTIVKVLEIPQVSLPSPLGCGPVLFPVEGKLRVNLRLTKNKYWSWIPKRWSNRSIYEQTVYQWYQHMIM